MTAQEMTPDKETLRPCPFCGNSEKVRENGKNYQVWCINDACPGAEFIDRKKWQNAYCWKELGSLRAENEELKKEILSLHNHRDEMTGYITRDGVQLEKLKVENEKLKTHSQIHHKEVLGHTLCVCCSHCQKENENLKKEIAHLKDDGPDWFYKTCVDDLKTENEKLKRENDFLKKEVNDLKHPF